MKTSLLALLLGILTLPLIDFMVYRTLIRKSTMKFISKIHFAQSIFGIVLMATLYLTIHTAHKADVYPIFNTITSTLLVLYLPKVIFLLFHSVSKLLGTLTTIGASIISITGRIIAILMIPYLIFCFTLAKERFTIDQVTLKYENLPSAFQGLRIVQLTDIHLGSFLHSSNAIEAMVNEVNRLQPDIILFTGDMINNFAYEMEPWIHTLQKLKSKYGNYAVMGNHDYGLYSTWDSKEEFNKNRVDFEQNMQKSGFVLLNNDYKKITIANDTLYLAGVENWGEPPFPQFGDIKKALKERGDLFTIVMSHDPTYWEAEITRYNVPLTLSGHTHAMQIQFRNKFIDWSPAKYIYPNYDGVYYADDQILNVSSGQGFLGFSGRIGFKPEINLIVLDK